MVREISKFYRSIKLKFSPVHMYRGFIIPTTIAFLQHITLIPSFTQLPIFLMVIHYYFHLAIRIGVGIIALRNS